MKAYVPLMAAAQVVVFMSMWWLEANKSPTSPTGLKAMNSTSCLWMDHSYDLWYRGARCRHRLVCCRRRRRPNDQFFRRHQSGQGLMVHRWVIGLTQGVEQVLLYSVK